VVEHLLRQGISVLATDLHDGPQFAASLKRLQDLGAELHLGPIARAISWRWTKSLQALVYRSTWNLFSEPRQWDRDHR